MNIIIINHTINTINDNINKFSTKISRGDNKNLLYTLPYIPFTSNGWKVVYYEDIFCTNANTLIEKIQTLLNTNEKIENILFFRANTLIMKYWEEIKNLKVYKIIYIDDIHGSKEMAELRTLGKYFFNYFDLILSTYAYCFRKYFNFVNNEKIYWFPHSFNEIFKINYNNNPKNKIFLSGCICSSYPMRQKMLELENIYPIDILNHPSYSKNKLHKIIGKKYIEKINEYRFGFTCCLTEQTPYLVQKFFEIPGSGALLIGYDKLIKSQMNKLGFIDMINYVSVDENNLEDKIKWLLDPNNIELVEQIRLNGYNFINNNHTHAKRTEDFLIWFNKIKIIKPNLIE